MAPILQAIVGLATGWLQDRYKRKQVELEADLKVTEAQANAKIRMLEKEHDASVAWENLSVANSGWKDEWFTVVLSIPMILCFIPGLSEFVMEGFVALERTPDWYQWVVLIAIASAFGYRKLADLMTLKKGGK